jgi:isoleucyl-tRNA synthetase
MEAVPESISFPKTEEKILALWQKIDAFQESLRRSEGKPEFSFYDGPPFATGLPHYGHILAGTIKDTVTRYAHQTGHHVSRRFGWDTHGLPIEFEIDKELGIKTRDDVLNFGIPNYNAECRKIVMRYSSEWEKIVGRLGRWIDFKNDYKTLDPSFMESVWWVFWRLNEQELVYRGFKVMPYSVGCTTPLSNFEANMAYREVRDPAVVVSFPLVDDPETKLVAWTTTPWTLPSNLALCVNPDLEYVKLKDKKTGEVYVLAEARIAQLYPPKKKGKADEEFDILEKFKGAQLKGKQYTPLFPYFEKERQNGAFRVLADSYVTSDSGTGVVHCAPAFGEDDFRVCELGEVIRKGGQGVPCPVDANGRFTEDVPDFKGVGVKDADPEIIKRLKAEKRLVQNGTILHSYPFCWRSDTPLIYRVVPSWFVAVEKIKERLLTNNAETYWVPGWVKEKRFHNWLEGARDWAVSRNRFWGTPIPMWVNPDHPEEMVCIGSIEELEKKSGVRVTDLHRESVDHITIPSPSGRGVLRRTEEVFDCWFESGSMPYAQVHYPFENKELFSNTFPADFIAEGIDQTRGWFYTLLVLSTALFDKPPFKNLIVNGLVLAADGKKMSKRLKNYPDPVLVIDQHGADALRLYLINSPVVRGEELRFVEKGVKDVVRDVFLPWFNAYRFFVQGVHQLEASGVRFVPDEKAALASDNVMDKWILSLTNTLLKFVQEEMAAYRLYTVVPKLVNFIEQLTNWYIRLNRKRIRGNDGDQERLYALNTLFIVILTITKAMAPFTPFFTEYLYQSLRMLLPAEQREDSVHYIMFPPPRDEFINLEIEESVAHMQSTIELGRAARDRRKMPLKYPLIDLTVVSANEKLLKSLESLSSYIRAELNIRSAVVTSDEGPFVRTRAEPDRKRLGPRLGKDVNKVAQAVLNLAHEQINEFRQNGKITVEGHEITTEDVKIIREFKGDSAAFEAVWTDQALVVLNLTVEESMRREGLARELVNRAQKLKKKAGLNVTDPVEIFIEVLEDNDQVASLLDSHHAYFRQTAKYPLLPAAYRPAHHLSVLRGDETVGTSSKVRVHIIRATFSFDLAALRKKCPSDKYAHNLQLFVATRDPESVKRTLKEGGGKVGFPLDDTTVELELGEDIFLSAGDLYQHLHPHVAH